MRLVQLKNDCKSEKYETYTKWKSWISFTSQYNHHLQRCIFVNVAPVWRYPPRRTRTAFFSSILELCVWRHWCLRSDFHSAAFEPLFNFGIMSLTRICRSLPNKLSTFFTFSLVTAVAGRSLRVSLSVLIRPALNCLNHRNDCARLMQCSLQFFFFVHEFSLKSLLKPSLQ